MKIKAIIMAVLMLLAVLAMYGCKDETMLDGYSSDTFILGEDDPLSIGSIEDLL